MDRFVAINVEPLERHASADAALSRDPAVVEGRSHGLDETFVAAAYEEAMSAALLRHAQSIA
ncbi:MAG: hypothetical protein U0326_14890 [Polyangiales bacterium]